MTSDDEPKGWDLGWYPDPDEPGTERFWNGATWTQRRDATAAPEHGLDADEPKRSTVWLVLGAMAVVALVGVVLLVVLIDGSDPIVEDDDAEFREVSVSDCEAPGALTAQQVRGSVENGSSERSDYRIDVAVFSADGTRIGTGTTDVRDVEPGQRAVWSSDTDTAEQDWDEGATCEVLDVERTASL